jgi:hypothetical protein
LRSNFSFAIFYLLGFQLRRNQIIAVGFVIRANGLFLLHQFLGNLPLEPAEIFRIPFAENLKAAMANPEIPNPVPALANRLALYFGSEVILGTP